MFMLPGDQERYPKFTAYMRDSFPTLLEVPGIVAGLRAWGFMTMDEIRTALMWESGNSYRGVAVDIREVVEWEVGAKNGRFANEIKREGRIFNEVLVSPRAVQAFEDGKGVSITGYGRKVYSVGAQILGQIVMHYAGNHFWTPKFNGTQLEAKARARRQGFFNQVYGGTPR